MYQQQASPLGGLNYVTKGERLFVKMIADFMDYRLLTATPVYIGGRLSSLILQVILSAGQFLAKGQRNKCDFC